MAKRGRKPLMEGEETVEIGFKCPKLINDQLLVAVETLKTLGFETNKSDVIRSIIEYRISNAVYIFREVSGASKK